MCVCERECVCVVCECVCVCVCVCGVYWQTFSEHLRQAFSKVSVITFSKVSAIVHFYIEALYTLPTWNLSLKVSNLSQCHSTFTTLRLCIHLLYEVCIFWKVSFLKIFKGLSWINHHQISAIVHIQIHNRGSWGAIVWALCMCHMKRRIHAIYDTCNLLCKFRIELPFDQLLEP